MKEINNFINEKLIVGKNIIHTTKSKYTIKDLQEALNYYEEYYDEFLEEKGEYPNWGELDNFFSNENWCEALMNGEDDSLVKIVDAIFDILYKK